MINRRISIETLAIVGLIFITFVLRIFSLGEVPLTPRETGSALAAWRTVSVDAPGEIVLADSPAVFWAQAVTFSLVGADEFAARVLTAIAGVFLTLTPFLFRDLIGRGRAFVFALLLTVSPIVLATSRFSEGITWAALFAMVGLWAIWRWWERGQYGVLTLVMFALMTLFASSGGLMLALILVIAGAITVSLTSMELEDETDIPLTQQIRERFRGFPWVMSGVTALLVIFVLSTAFFIYPQGMRFVTAQIEAFLRGWSESDTPSFFPLRIAIFYETATFVLVLISLIVMNLRQRVTFVERFLMAWLGIGIIAAVIYPGGTAADALWISLPLIGLASYGVSAAFDDYRFPLVWTGDWQHDDSESQVKRVNQVRWLMAGAMFILLFVLALHFQIAARGVLFVQDGSLSNYLSSLSMPGRGNVSIGLIWVMIAVLLMLVGYFLSSSLWGGAVPAQGYIIGFFLFVLVAHLGVSWNLVGARKDDAVEYWHLNAPANGTRLLRTTLEELAFRETQGMPQIPVAIYADESGLAAWIVRDFPNARFIESVEEGRFAEVVLLPQHILDVNGEEIDLNQPDLGTDYVGQRFVLSHNWHTDVLQGLDWLPWWAVRKVRVPQWDGETYILWVREDIYNSSPSVMQQP